MTRLGLKKNHQKLKLGNGDTVGDGPVFQEVVMQTAPHHTAGTTGLIFPALLGFVLGTAGQLQQQHFGPGLSMDLFMLLALVLFALAATKYVVNI